MLQQYRDGETRNIGGTTYVRQPGGQWVPQGQAQGPVLTPITPPRQPAPQTPAQQQADVIDVQRGQADLARAPIETERAIIERDRARMQLEQSEREAEEARRLAQGGEQRRATALNELRQTIINAREAQRLSREGWFTTGFGADIAHSIAPGGSSQADLRALLNQISSNTAFGRLQRMREESPTGGALGAVSERELELLRSSVASLDVSQSDEQFQRNMQNIIDAYARIYEGLGGNPADLAEQLQRGGNRDDENFIGSFGVDNSLVVNVEGGRLPRSLDEASPEFLAAYAEAKRSNPGLTFQQFIEQYGRPPPPAPPRGIGQQLLDATVNTGAGLGQGLAAIPDAAASALGAVLGTATDVLPGVPEWVSDSLRNPVTIGGSIESAAPTPDDTGGQVTRFLSQMFGGAASTPVRLQRAVTNRVVGSVPTRPAPSPAPPPSRIMDDARALDIPMMPADVGGATTRTLTAGVAQTPLGAAPIVRAANRTVDASSRALTKIARGSGEPANRLEAGEAATRGALSFRSSSRTEAGRLYDQAARMSEDVRVTPRQSLQVLDRHIQELGENPAGSEALSFLTQLRGRLGEANGVTVAGIRGMRTQLRDRFLSAGLRGSDVERRVMEVVDAASDDVAASLINAGKGEAAEVYRAADAAWRARADTLDNIIMPIIGRRGERSAEEVFKQLQAATQSNGARLNRFIASLPEDEAAVVRASLISGLGRARAGSQNAAGDAFSLDTFLTQWNSLSPSSRNVLFRGESRQAIERLARVAERTKAAGAYANRARTGGVIATLGTGASFSFGFEVLATALAGQFAAGLLLASPKVANVLARFGRARNPSEARSIIRSLSARAGTNPALAGDIAELEGRLLEAISASPATRAAAEQNEDIR